jgi:hypothetical protein
MSEFHIHSNASANLKCVTLRFVNNVDMIETPLRAIIISEIWKSIMTPTYSTMNLVIVWTINVVPNSFCLAIYYLSEIGSFGISIPSSISFLQELITHFVIWHSCDLVSCLQAVSIQYQREGPKYIFLSSGWTNPTLDPWASTNTFRVPKLTFIVTLLRCDVWYHQSTLPVLVIDIISWSKDYGYFVWVWYSNKTWWLDRMAILTMGVSAYHIILLITRPRY